MTSSFHRRLGVLLVSAAAGFGVWKGVPGTDLDRAAFTAVASGFVNPPLFVTGEGSYAAPWSLRAFSTESKPDRRQAPVIVSLGDDPTGFFQSSPPAPIDLAVIFTNFQRLGAKKAATAAVLAWDAPDPVGLAALEKSLSRFESLVMAAPLSRGAVSSAMPSAFRRASIPLTAVHGDTSALPVVNRLPIPGVVLGGESALAGFSVLELETGDGFAPLLARWDDRAVLAFPLLTVLQRLNLPLSGVEVRLGEYLKLSPAGPIVPIDSYGRLVLPRKAISGYAEISAEALIDGGDDLFPKQAPDPVILRDDRSALDPATRAFSRSLPAMVAAIASDEGMAQAHAYPRLSRAWEIGVLSALVVLLTALSGAADSVRRLGAPLLAAASLAAQWIALGCASIWLPGIPALAAIVAAWIVAGRIAKRPGRLRPPAPPAVPAAGAEPLPEPPAPVKKAKPPAKKAAKKTAKKTTTKNATKIATKTASPKAPRTKKPPSNS